MCIKKVACGLQKVKREDGREVLEPIYVEVETPEDMHRVSGKIESCKTVTPKIVEEKVQEVGIITPTANNIDAPTNNIDSPIGNDSPTANKVSTDSKEVSTDSKEVSTDSKEVVCVETGEVFSSVRQASKSSDVDFSSIAKCCNGKRKTAGGYHWQYL